jgi:predicted RNA-binding Zn-ribbon protein involved in translation (DUF1610 family)
MELDDVQSKYAQRLRACKSCKLIKTEDQFATHGCDNCGLDADSKAARREWMENNTTDDYEG